MSDQANQYKNLGNEAFKNKDYEQAIQHFTKAIQCNPNDHVFYSNRSGSYLNAGKYQQALEDAETCVKLNAGWARGYQRKGTALFYLDRLSDAISVYKEGLKHEPENQQLKNDLKAAQQKQSQQSQSQQGMIQAFMKLANHPETKDFLSDPQFMQKIQTIVQNPAAYSYFASDPKIQKAFEVISSAGTSNNFNFEDLMKNAQQQGAEKMDQEPPVKPQSPPKKKAEPKPEPPKQVDPAEEAKNEGNNEYKKKNFEKAIELYQKAIDLKPSEPLYFNNKAAAYIELGKFAEAHNELDKADKLFEEGLNDYVKKAKVLARRASLLAKENRLQESITTYEKSLLQDGVQKVKDELKVVKKQKKQKDAKDYINPQLAQKACEAGNSFFKQGKFPQALEQYEEAIKRGPEVAKYYSNSGTVYIKLMEWGRAKQSFETALKKDPTYIKAYAKKGDCHYAMKEFHKALQTYEAGLKIDATNELCKSGITKTQNAIYSASAGSTEEEKQARAQRAMMDPQIKQILQTPEVMNALNDLQSNPAAIQSIMKNPSLAAKIEKLIQAGVIGTG